MGKKSTAGRRGRKAPEVGQSCTGEASGGETPEAGLWDTAEPQGRVARGTDAQERGQHSAVEACGGGVPKMGQMTEECCVAEQPAALSNGSRGAAFRRN